jgi:hypothetical protein
MLIAAELRQLTVTVPGQAPTFANAINPQGTNTLTGSIVKSNPHL